MIEYAGIYLKKPSAEYARTMNISDAVSSIRSLHKLLSSYGGTDILKFFRVREGREVGDGWTFVELGH